LAIFATLLQICVPRNTR